MADDLAAWLLEQIDEDEKRVLRADQERRSQVPFVPYDHSWLGSHQGLVVAQVVRMRAECEVKRRIVASYYGAGVQLTSDPQWLAMQRAERSVLLEVLRLLALPYADRHGYREEWRP